MIYASISRSAPWAMDPSVSTRGHEPMIRSGQLDTESLDGWITDNAPECLNADPFDVFNEPERHFYFLNARDHRGYFTELYVQHYLEEEPMEQSPQTPAIGVSTKKQGTMSDTLTRFIQAYDEAENRTDDDEALAAISRAAEIILTPDELAVFLCQEEEPMEQ
jgi:hypothetical protein